MKRIITLLACGAVLFIAPAEAQLNFQRLLGDSDDEFFYDVKTTADDGYILTGYTTSTLTGGKDLYLVKTDGDGVLQWGRAFGGAADDIGYAVIEISGNSGYLAVGSTNSFSATGDRDILVVRVDMNGNLLWATQYGTPNYHEEARDVVRTSEQGQVAFALTGFRSDLTGLQASDLIVLKFSNSGNILWSRAMNFMFNGVVLSDKGYALIDNGMGELYATGSVIDPNGTAWDVALVKVDPNGNILWHYKYGAGNHEEGFAIDRNEMGGYVITGYTSSFGAGGDDVLLMRVDPNGQMVWNMAYGTPGNEYGEDVIMTLDGSHAITGYTDSRTPGSNDALLIKTGINGTFTWGHLYGGIGSDEGYGLVQPDNTGYLLAGLSWDSFGPIDMEGYMVRTDATGDVVCHDTAWNFSSMSPQFKRDSLVAMVDTNMTLRLPQLIIDSVDEDSLLCGILTGIKPVESNTGFSIFPNPGPAPYQLSLPGISGEITVEVHDLQGRLVHRQKAQIEPGMESVWLDFRSSNGVYLVTVKHRKGLITKKLVKNR